MTTYFVGIGGNDGNTGLSWAQRFLTLNAAEDEPLVANDTVYVGPGVYREQLTCDVSGSSGQPITYIGDVSGENTDGIGGIVRITGSDDDQTGSRSYCIYATGKSYRTFRGFVFDMAILAQLNATAGCNGWIVEDCYFGTNDDDSDVGCILYPTADDLFIIRRCVSVCSGRSFSVSSGSDISASASSVIENCFIIGNSTFHAILVSSVDGFIIKNNTIIGASTGIRVESLAESQFVDVNNCIIELCYYGLYASALGEIVEDYNSVPFSNGTPRTNVNVGSNSNTYPSLFETPVLLDTFAQYPWKFGELSKCSQLAGIAGTGESSDDLYGVDRPATSAKKSWGAIQYKPGERETTTTYDSSAASIKLADAGRHQIFVPVTAVSTTITIRVYREANYAGTLPQMMIRQPGQSARTTVDVGSVSTWNLLSDTFTPDSGTNYVIVELVTNNTATSGSYAVYFDSLSVS